MSKIKMVTKSNIISIPESNSQKKIQAIKLAKKGIQKTKIAKELGVARKTIHQWINQEIQEFTHLPPEKKIKVWESEACKDLRLAASARESLQEMLDSDNESVKPDTKRAIMHSASVVAGIKWDKARLEAGQGVSGDIHAIVINMYDTRIKEADEPPKPQDAAGNAIDI